MGEMNKQQICAALGVSESTIRRLEQAGLPYTPVGKRAKRYDLDECKTWLRQNESALAGPAKILGPAARIKPADPAFLESCGRMRLRVTPSPK